MSAPYVLLVIVAVFLLAGFAFFVSRVVINKLTEVRRNRRYAQPRVRTRRRKSFCAFEAASAELAKKID